MRQKVTIITTQHKTQIRTITALCEPCFTFKHVSQEPDSQVSLDNASFTIKSNFKT